MGPAKWKSSRRFHRRVETRPSRLSKDERNECRVGLVAAYFDAVVRVLLPRPGMGRLDRHRNSQLRRCRAMVALVDIPTDPREGIPDPPDVRKTDHDH